jgi:hypothetical protein
MRNVGLPGSLGRRRKEVFTALSLELGRMLLDDKNLDCPLDAWPRVVGYDMQLDASAHSCRAH